jgi:hypothetical protein
MPPFEILPKPKTSGGLKETQEELIAERRNILVTWATLIVQTAGITRIQDLDFPAQQGKSKKRLDQRKAGTRSLPLPCLRGHEGQVGRRVEADVPLPGGIGL